MAKKKRKKNQNKQNDVQELKKRWSVKDAIFLLFYITLSIGVVWVIVLGNIKGDYWPDILISIISITLSAYLTTLQVLPKKTKFVIITVSIFVCVHTGYKVIKTHKNEELKAKESEYYHQSQERIELYGKGLSDSDIWRYDKDPLLKHTLIEADQDRDKGDFIIAINKYKSCLKHPSISVETQHWSNGNVAKCYSSLRNLKLAELHWNLALQIAKKIDDEMVKTWFVGRSYGGLGDLYFSFKKYDQALGSYNKSLQVYKDGGAITGTAAGYYNVALTYSVTKKYKQALEAYKNCIDFSEKHDEKGVIANSLYNIAIILWDTKQATYNEVINQCDKSINIAIAISDRDCIVRAANFAAHLSFENNQFNRSIEYNKKFIEYSKNKFTTEVGAAMAIVGELYFLSRNYELSLNYYEQAKDVFSRIGNNEFFVESLEKAGLTCTFMGRPSEALRYWSEALDASRKFGFDDRERIITTNIKNLKSTNNTKYQ